MKEEHAFKLLELILEYERPLNSTDYTRHVQAILEQRRPVTVYWGSMAYTEM